MSFDHFKKEIVHESQEQLRQRLQKANKQLAETKAEFEKARGLPVSERGKLSTGATRSLKRKRAIILTKLQEATK